LITRMIFIWFMRERGLINKDLFERQKIQDILKNLNNDESSYYAAILQNLFFATLSTKKEERQFGSEIRGHKGYNPDFGNQYVFRYQEMFKNPEKIEDYFGDVPFLNGGLFECLDDKKNGIIIDGFSRTKKNQPKIPNLLFFATEERVDLNKVYGTTNKTYKVRGLLDIFSSFNFTIDENSPDDADIALDPELLGRVFENLLASFNPETSDTARKATGSYYTPREIVDYMVAESLKAYFKTHLTDIEKIDEKLEQLFSKESLENPFDENQSKKLVEMIESVKIVDPAVGSGAFPMGALNKLVFILNKIDPGNKLWKEAQLKAADSIPDPSARRMAKERIEEFFEGKNADYGRKLYLIQRCIYGVDIQQIAVEIAKLRFFISLLVDEKIDKEKDNWGIEPLPNLDFKIMQGNSLISEFLGIDFDNGNHKQEQKQAGLPFDQDDDSLIKEFEQKKIDFQNEADKDKKAELKQEVEDLMIRIFEAKVKRQKGDYFRRLEEIENKYSLLPNQKQREEIIAQEKQKLSRNSGFDLNNTEKQLREFTSKKKIRPFFPWKLYFAEVFHEKGGFDVVIANPPYIQLQKAFDAKRKYADLYKDCGYQNFNRTGDIYCLFYEKGMQLLKEDGILIYISSNKWMRAGYGETLRNFFTKYNPKILIDLGPGIFENATVDTNILLIQKSSPLKIFELRAVTLEKENNKDIDISQQLSRKGVILKNLSQEAWFIGSSAEQKLKEKIERIGKPLKKWDVNIYRGILTGLNEAFIITTEKRNEILANCQDEDERKRTEAIIKPILRGRDIKRYYYEWVDLWVIFIPWHFPLHEDLSIQGASEKAEREFQKQYPVIYNHLLKFKEPLLKRNKEETGIRYEWYALQRCAATYYSEFEKEKVVWGNISYNSEFCFAERGIFINAPANLIVSAGTSIKYLVGIMNSKIFDWQFKQLGIFLGHAYEWKKQYVEQVKLPPITATNQLIVQQIEALVDKILFAKKQNPQADTQEYERQIDQLVYQLYGLTPEEIKIVENSQA